jgi:hypothetical protein
MCPPASLSPGRPRRMTAVAQRHEVRWVETSCRIDADRDEVVNLRRWFHASMDATVHAERRPSEHQLAQHSPPAVVPASSGAPSVVVPLRPRPTAMGWTVTAANTSVDAAHAGHRAIVAQAPGVHRLRTSNSVLSAIGPPTAAGEGGVAMRRSKPPETAGASHASLGL